MVYILSILGIALIIFMLAKNMDIKVTLLIGGVLLMYVAILMGNEIALRGFKSAGVALLDPIFAIPQQFIKTLSRAGIIILVLGGYSSYMSKIHANQVTVEVLTKPLGRIKAVYLLVPVVFLIGNCLSLVVPSASNLAIILLSTLYPVLISAGMSKLTAAGVIATTATIIPTPLGGDNIAIVEELRKTVEYADLTVAEYVFTKHAMVSIPTLLVMAGVHYIWQRYMDRKVPELRAEATEETTERVIDSMSTLAVCVYAVLPVLPIIFLLIVYALGMMGIATIEVNVALATFTSFFVALIVNCISQRSIKSAIESAGDFTNGLGKTMGVVSLLVSASIFVVGLKSIGLISTLQGIMQSVQVAGWVLPLLLVFFTIIIVVLSGSGVALFFAMVPLMVPLAMAANINPLAVTLPMGLGGNLMRACSPVAAVILIVAGTVKVSPYAIVKRTVVPSVTGLIFMFILSMMLFL